MALYALSYDEPDALADFARSQAISFPLLSDPDSEIIERFGILNTLVDPDDHPWYGVPFPGVYVIAADGSITDKFFESSFMLRPSAEQLLRSALGKQIELAPIEAAEDQVVVDVHFDGDALHAGVLRDLIIRLAVPPGFHLYGDPVPDGMVATTVEIDAAAGLVVQPAILPATQPHTLAGTGETLQVFNGDVLIRVPITHMSRSLSDDNDDNLVQPVSGTVRWQSCDDHACQLPRSETFSIDIPAVRHNSSRSTAEGAPQVDMLAHLTKMVSRRTDRTLQQVMSDMTNPDG